MASGTPRAAGAPARSGFLESLSCGSERELQILGTVAGEGTETGVCCCHPGAEHRAPPASTVSTSRITWFLPCFPVVVPGVALPKRESRDGDNGVVSPRPYGQLCRRLPGEGGGARGWQQFVGLV